jgi:hypothetical protein
MILRSFPRAALCGGVGPKPSASRSPTHSFNNGMPIMTVF